MRAAVIGAGLGGLSAAIGLAARGAAVTVFEAGDRPGGKAGQVVLDGVAVDTGPSVLTMPGVLDDILKLSGRRLDEAVVLRDPRPSFRYRYPDGAVVDVYPTAEETLESVAAPSAPGRGRSWPPSWPTPTASGPPPRPTSSTARRRPWGG